NDGFRSTQLQRADCVGAFLNLPRSILPCVRSSIMAFFRTHSPAATKKPVHVACLTLFALAFPAALGCSAHGGDSMATSSAALSSPSKVLMKPTGGLGHTNTSAVGCAASGEWACVTDGTSFAANDGDKTHVSSTAAGGKLG